MTYVEGDVISPSNLIIPEATLVRGFSGAMIASGANLYVSGGKLWFSIEDKRELVTST